MRLPTGHYLGPLNQTPVRTESKTPTSGPRKLLLRRLWPPRRFGLECRTRLEEKDMLFHVTHTHSWDACPYNDPDRARETFGRAFAGFVDSDVDVIGAWTDAPAHKFFIVVDATSAVQIEEILAPIIDIGWAETRPVVDTADILKRRTAGD